MKRYILFWAVASLMAWSATTAHGQARPASTGGVAGTVVDAQSGEPLSTAQVRVLELKRGDLSHADGTFHLEQLPEGRYTLVVQRLGYATAKEVVEVVPDRSVRVDFRLQPSAIEVSGLVVTGSGRERAAADAYRPTTVKEGAALRRDLGSSVAATLAGEPGISQRYNGPAAAQPVVRGLGGDRVLVLEDGNRTGDVASTASDHAVTVEPLTAERIEVVRGPAGLLYGSNALGGVINVVREEVPRTLGDRITGTASVQGETVNEGVTAGASALGSVGSLALRAELSGRIAEDTQTPLGVLPSSSMEGYNAGAGASWVGSDGFAGAAVRGYGLRYEVPGSFQGTVIPGAHAGGVTIDVERNALRLEAAHLSGIGPFSSIEWSGGATRFRQDEIEAGGGIGTQFGLLTGTTNLIARHRHAGDELFLEGAVGLWGMAKDLQVSGSSGSRPAQQLALAGFLFEELGWDPVRLQAGVRYDWTRIQPLDTRGGTLGEIGPREFGSFSGSLAALAQPFDGVVLGASVARAFRTPSIEELFSNGPHLADYSFNIGNPELESEYGHGADLFARVDLPGLRGEAAVYRNWINDFIYYAPTGRLDPRLGRFPVYQAAQDDAVLQGFEASLQWEVRRQLALDGSIGYVQGWRSDARVPLPGMPPLHGELGVRYDPGAFFVSAGWEGAAAQERTAYTLRDRLPGDGVEIFCRGADAEGERVPLECPTEGYSLWNVGAGLRWTAWDRLNTLTLEVENLMDTAWYDHLSRIKEVAPQPGRNLRLLYRVNF